MFPYLYLRLCLKKKPTMTNLCDVIYVVNKTHFFVNPSLMNYFFLFRDCKFCPKFVSRGHAFLKGSFITKKEEFYMANGNKNKMSTTRQRLFLFAITILSSLILFFYVQYYVSRRTALPYSCMSKVISSSSSLIKRH